MHSMRAAALHRPLQDHGLEQYEIEQALGPLLALSFPPIYSRPFCRSKVVNARQKDAACVSRFHAKRMILAGLIAVA